MIVPWIDRPKFLSQFSCPALPAVIGHRGAAARAPENTLAGLRQAKALGCIWVEFDVHLTADSVPVLCHDPRLERTTDGKGRISGLPFDAVRTCDAGSRFSPSFAGERVPSLVEALSLAAELGLGANIEIKIDRGQPAKIAGAVVATLSNLPAPPEVMISSFHPATLVEVRKLSASIPTGILFRVLPGDWARIALNLDCAVIGANHHRLTSRRAAEVRAAGYQLTAYTVNDSDRALQLFEWGVSSVFSDVPDQILAALAAAPPRQAAAAGLNSR